MASLIEREAIQIVRPLRQLESVPEYPKLIDMLLPRFSHVAFYKKQLPTRISKESHKESCRRGWEMRKLLTPERIAELIPVIQQLYDAGKSSVLIADKLQIHASSVERIMLKN